MLYYLFEYLSQYDVPGAGVFKYLTFRAALAVIVSLIISMLFGAKLIDLLRKKLIGETVRNLGLKGEESKQGTPTMGGIIILSSILIPTLLFAKLHNIYVLLMLVTTIMLGLIGFMDDYIKVFKKDKRGLAGKFKVIGQILVGLVTGCVLYFHPDVKVKTELYETRYEINEGIINENNMSNWRESKSHITTIPFIKNNEFNYDWFISFISDQAVNYAWIIFIPIVIFIVTAVSNGANLTDGLDGLATGSSAIIGSTLAIFAYVSGNYVFADYLNIMYIPHVGELVIFMAAFVGACIGFLWYNAYPAQVFMGDTGSLSLGGIIAIFSLAVRKEMLIPIFCGVFLIENLSVIIQVAYFKYTKKKFGEGRRIFLMAPLHHHFQKKGLHESKIVARFWIVGILLAILSIVTLKLR